MSLSGPNSRLASVGPVEAPANVYGLNSLAGNLTISTADNFNTFTVTVTGTIPYTQQFTSADKRTSPVAIAGVNDESWSVTGSGTRTDVDRISFAGVPLTYLELATFYRQQPATPPSAYNAEFIVAALSNAWTQPSAMPVSGSAVYNGQSYGIAIVSPPGETFRTTSAFQLTADFAAGNVSGALTNFSFFKFDTGASTATPGSATGLNVTFLVPITGSSFSGTVSGTGINLGRVEGMFAGPAAEEVGGSYHASGPDVALIGAFAGKK